MSVLGSNKSERLIGMTFFIYGIGIKCYMEASLFDEIADILEFKSRFSVPCLCRHVDETCLSGARRGASV